MHYSALFSRCGKALKRSKKGLDNFWTTLSINALLISSLHGKNEHFAAFQLVKADTALLLIIGAVRLLEMDTPQAFFGVFKSEGAYLIYKLFMGVLAFFLSLLRKFDR